MRSKTLDPTRTGQEAEALEVGLSFSRQDEGWASREMARFVEATVESEAAFASA